MLVYAVVEHEWEESYIIGMYSSREAAEAAIAEVLQGEEEWEGWYFDIVVRELQ